VLIKDVQGEVLVEKIGLLIISVSYNPIFEFCKHHLQSQGGSWKNLRPVN
jgi:hypothetical protein